MNIHDSDANTVGTYSPCYSEPDTSLGSKNTIKLNEITQMYFVLN